MKRLVLLAALTLCGCDGDYVETWEYQTMVPYGSTPQQLSAIEADLRSNGFVRVRMYVRRSAFSDKPFATEIYATRREASND